MTLKKTMSKAVFVSHREDFLNIYKAIKSKAVFIQIIYIRCLIIPYSI